MTTRQVYANTVRSRIQRNSSTNGAITPVAGSSSNSFSRPINATAYRNSYNDYEDEEDYYTGYSSNRSQYPQARTSYQVTPAPALRPTTEQMRLLRLNQFQSKYDTDKEAFKIKEEERRRKKLEEKLKRYKGVGELGNKLTGHNLTEEEKHFELWQSRENYNAQYQNDANHAQLEKQKREEEERRIALERLSLEESSTDTSNGVRLGGTTVNRVKGDHPLLKQLQK